AEKLMAEAPALYPDRRGAFQFALAFGPKVRSDEELVAEIRQLLAAPIFTGEGYRKIWARLRQNGVRTCKDRVLRLLREQQLLSPSRQPEPTPTNPHVHACDDG